MLLQDPEQNFAQRLIFQKFVPCRIKAITERSLRLLSAIHEALGVTKSEFGVLLVVMEHRSLSSRDLARTTGIDKATITRALDRLFAKGLISREKSKADSRLIQVAPTAQGMVLFAEIEEKTLEWNENFMNGLLQAEVAKFLGILDKLDANLSELEVSSDRA